MAERNTFVGLDVHKDSIATALAESGRFGEVRHYGTVDADACRAGWRKLPHEAREGMAETATTWSDELAVATARGRYNQRARLQVSPAKAGRHITGGYCPAKAGRHIVWRILSG